ncbi:uncharacterized protein LOC124420763 isoform X1 [Lucilia cuprina]|uniref:uncharacterized protein LOC124420763 isoform X1 n=1 Tax=Lucilia cuprina TaxID=7375 RepID=UPI001F067D54|nr:uncharacterized protein LOC124420763 isoform X1 [Lucilia cuprina]
MRFLLSFCFILTLIALSGARSLAWGRRNSTIDHMLYLEHVLRFPIKDFIQEIYVVYPKVGSKVKGKNVTAIYVFDHFTNSSGAVATYTRPLKKSNSSIVILKSQRSRGINTTVEFYGK